MFQNKEMAAILVTTKPILGELNSIFMQTFSFVSVNLHTYMLAGHMSENALFCF